MQPVLVIHGGAGEVLLRDRSQRHREHVRARILKHLRDVYGELQAGGDAVHAVVQACARLEDDEEFNAGTGSVLHADGSVRMSASLMCAQARRFSGVVNVQNVRNPVLLAHRLQTEEDRVISESGLPGLIQELGLPVHEPRTAARLQELQQGSAPLGVGTVGAVALDAAGHLAAATSTGGRGHAKVGRVSDSCTAAGNFASRLAAVSCTGRGEDIVEMGFAVRVVVRVDDGRSLQGALEQSLAEAESDARQLAAIALDSSGRPAWGSTTGLLVAASFDGRAPRLAF